MQSSNKQYDLLATAFFVHAVIAVCMFTAELLKDRAVSGI